MRLDFEEITIQDKQRRVFYSLSFSLVTGSLVSVSGGSRSGKSTLLLAASGHIPLQAGWIGIDSDESAESLSAQHVKPTWKDLGVGPIPGFSPLFETLTVREHLLFQGKLHKQKMSNARLEEVLTSFDLCDVQRQRIKDLDRFSYFRVSLALTTLHRPAFILLDEPDVGLTDEEWDSAKTYLLDLTKDDYGVLYTTVLMSSAAYASTVVCLPSGEVIQP
jgi:ABC-type multidrug transport system ATPase subunit